MTKILSIAASLLIVVLTSNFASAAITGVFTDQGVVNGAQVFGFEITSDEDITGLDFSSATGSGFSGAFNNTGIDTDFDSIPDSPLTFTPAAPQPGALQETYFSISPSGLLSVSVEDSVTGGNFLGAAYTLDGGGTLIPANTPTNVAYLSMSGSTSPTFIGGFGATQSGDVPITLGGPAVPEPTTLALASLGMIGLLGNRRRRS